MITNERQYRAARKSLEALSSDLAKFDELALVRLGVDPVIIAAQRRSLGSEISRLERLIRRYESLRTGEVREIKVQNLASIGLGLIEARAAVGLTQKDLGDRLKLKEQQIQRYEAEFYRSASLHRLQEVAEALSVSLGVTITLGDEQEFPARPIPQFDTARLPVREMKRRGWLAEVDLAGVTGASDVDLAAEFVRSALGDGGGQALHRQKIRSGGKVDDYAILAWKARVLQRARKVRRQHQQHMPIDPLFVRRLVGLSALPDGPVQAVMKLREAGVLVVFEEHLKGTHLDGAAMLLDNALPVIGLTIRHDRVDNFWFVLLHELAHIVCHRDRGLLEGFFDDESVPSNDALEREADEFASNALIPEEQWQASFVRFSKSRAQVEAFADKLGIGAAIVAGRIRNERQDYTVFSDLIGNRGVRSQLAEAGLLDP